MKRYFINGKEISEQEAKAIYKGRDELPNSRNSFRRCGKLKYSL